MKNQIENALAEVQSTYNSLRDTGEDWVEDTLNEIDMDVLNTLELCETFHDSEFDTVEKFFMSDILNDEQRIKLLQVWPEKFYDLTEEELVITSLD
jgi:hypothetical protein